MESDRFIKVFERFVEVQEEMLLELKALRAFPSNAQIKPDPLKNLIDNVDVKQILKISDSTLYRLKTSKLISSVRIGSRTYYDIEEIKKIANYFKK